MQGLTAVLAGLLAVVLVPLALAGGTAWMLLPGHLLFAITCALGAILAGWDGHPGRARAFGGGYLVATLAVVLALTVGSEARDGSWYWMLPWALGLFWAWVPPVIAGIFAEIGTSRRRARTRRVVRRRRMQKRHLVSREEAEKRRRQAERKAQQEAAPTAEA